MDAYTDLHRFCSYATKSGFLAMNPLSVYVMVEMSLCMYKGCFSIAEISKFSSPCRDKMAPVNVFEAEYSTHTHLTCTHNYLPPHVIFTFLTHLRVILTSILVWL